ncbi:MAG: hypothetical protein E7314_06880 [Clostridiales bacterium]|nr:hypothetical protein [Clostridiales bacterium]
MKNKKTEVFEITEHSFYETSYEEPEAVEKEKKMLDMMPRKTYEEAKRELAKKSSEKRLN